MPELPPIHGPGALLEAVAQAERELIAKFLAKEADVGGEVILAIMADRILALHHRKG